jgi:hypothetical protein
LHLDLVVGESDYPKLKVGQHGFVALSGLDGASFPIEIESIGTLPTTNQGVVTYQARARLRMDSVAALPPGLTPSPPSTSQGAQPGQGVIQTGPVFIGPGNTTQGGAVPFGGTGPQTLQPGSAPSSSQRAKPAPGMQGQATVITDEKFSVLTVPVRAVTQQGFESVVKVQKDDGSVETVKVKTGVRNAQVVEITEGLKEGQKVILPGAPTTPAGGTGNQNGTFAIPAGGVSGPGGGGAPTIIQFGPGGP